jgi:hypothetical protein
VPLQGYARNQIWCEITAPACELTAWTQMLGPHREGPPVRAPAAPAARFSVAGLQARGGRRLRLRLAGTWPRAAETAAAISRPPGHPVRLASPAAPATRKDSHQGPWNLDAWRDSRAIRYGPRSKTSRA